MSTSDELRPPERVRGEVKWFNNNKGFGFLTQTDGQDVFVHFSWVQRRASKELYEGEAVEFTVVKGAKGLQAHDVVPLVEVEGRDDAESEFLAFTLIEDRVRLVSLTRDGTYQFLDVAQTLHGIFYVASETRALEGAVDELESLLNSASAKEAEFQDFFERYPQFVLNDEYKAAHPHIVLERTDAEPLIPDFILEPVDQGALCDLLEIKLPAAEIFVLKKNRMRFSAAVLEACAQLREYATFFDSEENRRRVAETHGLTAYKPKMMVVIGRRGSVSPVAIRKMEMDMPALQLRTYDAVLARAQQRLVAMKRGSGGR